MTQIPKPQRDLRARLAAADRYFQKQEGMRLILRSVPWLCGLMLLPLALDLALRLSSQVRAGSLALFIVASAGALAAAAFVALVRRNRLERIARLLESRDGTLGSALINYLQLTTEFSKQEPPPKTRQLTELALARYEQALEPVDLTRVAKTPEVKRDVRKAGIALFVLGLILLGALPITSVLLPRFFDPFGAHPPFSFTRLNIVEPDNDAVQVVYDGEINIRVKSGGHRPSELYLSYFNPQTPKQVTTVPMLDKGSSGFLQQIKGIESELIVYAHTADQGSQSIRRKIGVQLIPEIAEAFVTVQPPAYTGLPAEEEPFAFKGLQALQGSTLTFRLSSNRPLNGGSIEFTGTDAKSAQIGLVASGDKVVTGSLLANESGSLEFSVVDVTGLSSAKKIAAALTVTHDLGPEISIDEPRKDAFVSDDYSVTAKISARDDYGLKTVRIHRALNDVFSMPIVREFVDLEGKPTREAQEAVLFDIPNLGLKSGDVISFFAEAIDNAPEPHIARSDTIRLTVISKEEYNNYLREQTDITRLETKYGELMDRLESALEKQKQLDAAIREIQKELAEGKLAPEEAAKKIAALQSEQKSINDELNQLADSMENFTRKDPLYDIEKELQKHLNELAAEIKSSTAENQKSSDGASGQEPKEALQALADASKEQLEQLAKESQQLDEKIMQSLRDTSTIDALTKDFNYFQHLYKKQCSLAQMAKPYQDKGELSRDDQIALNDLAGQQNQVQGELNELLERLRKNAEAAEQEFPKAAQSGRDLADGIKSLRIPALTGQAAHMMAGGDGPGSARMAEAARTEMEKLFGDCPGGMACLSDELDQYLKLNRMNPGSTFRQMAMSRRFGSGNIPGQGTGQGMAGSAGYMGSSGADFSVMGAEGDLGSDGSGNGDERRSNSASGLEKFNNVELEKTGGAQQSNAQKQESEAAKGEVTIDRYREVVDAYFEKVTK